ncbi:hypothetical protein B7486_11520 [cyanobacterium TDX16]|nr:hypothetical protein B7486_11520 [cyanobacterium TDX16]
MHNANHSALWYLETIAPARVRPSPLKNTQEAKRPNTSPPRELQASAQTFFAYCHIQKRIAAPDQNPRRKAWPE